MWILSLDIKVWGWCAPSEPCGYADSVTAHITHLVGAEYRQDEPGRIPAHVLPVLQDSMLPTESGDSTQRHSQGQRLN